MFGHVSLILAKGGGQPKWKIAKCFVSNCHAACFCTLAQDPEFQEMVLLLAPYLQDGLPSLNNIPCIKI